MIILPSDHQTAPTTYLDQPRAILRSRSRIEDLGRCPSADCVGALFRADDQRTPLFVRAA